MNLFALGRDQGNVHNGAAFANLFAEQDGERSRAISLKAGHGLAPLLHDLGLGLGRWGRRRIIRSRRWRWGRFGQALMHGKELAHRRQGRQLQHHAPALDVHVAGGVTCHVAQLVANGRALGTRSIRALLPDDGAGPWHVLPDGQGHVQRHLLACGRVAGVVIARNGPPPDHLATHIWQRAKSGRGSEACRLQPPHAKGRVGPAQGARAIVPQLVPVATGHIAHMQRGLGRR